MGRPLGFFEAIRQQRIECPYICCYGQGRKVAPGRGRKSALSLEDQLLVTLMRLRLGRLEQELAYMFNVDAGTISRVFNKWINFLYMRLGMIPIWPEWADVEKTMPETFKTS